MYQFERGSLRTRYANFREGYSLDFHRRGRAGEALDDRSIWKFRIAHSSDPVRGSIWLYVIHPFLDHRTQFLACLEVFDNHRTLCRTLLLYRSFQRTVSFVSSTLFCS